MRVLLMEFPQHPKAADIPGEYRYGAAFLVAPLSYAGREINPSGLNRYRYRE
jgi:alpha-glucosidase (family GH31 glycosyl hydrolase)